MTRHLGVQVVRSLENLRTKSLPLAIPLVAASFTIAVIVPVGAGPAVASGDFTRGLSPSSMSEDITTGLPEGNFTCESCDFPDSENPPNAFDDNSNTKYLSFFGDDNSKDGWNLIIDANDSYVISSLSFVTANDRDERDPVLISVYGSTSGTDGPWTAIVTGLALNPPEARKTAFGPYPFDNSTAYQYFKIVFEQVRDEEEANSIQIAEISIAGEKRTFDFSFPRLEIKPPTELPATGSSQSLSLIALAITAGGGLVLTLGRRRRSGIPARS